VPAPGGKLASRFKAGHNGMMRRLFLLFALPLAACTNKLATIPEVTYRPSVQQPAERGELVGLGIDQLTQRLGQPALQVREGDSVKLQYRGSNCVLDAYLYRATSGQGLQRVSHVDSRDREGRDVDQRACLAELEAL